MLRGKFIALNICWENRSQINNLSFHHRKIAGEIAHKDQSKQKRKNNNIRVEINEIENRKKGKKSMK